MKKIIYRQKEIIMVFIFISLLFIITIDIKTKKNAEIIKKLNLPTPTITIIEYILIDSHRGEPPVIDFKNQGQQDNNYYFKLLKNKIINDNLSAQVWFNDKCNQFWLMDRETEYQIERHERHIAECGTAVFGTAPLLDMFFIDKKSEKIYRLDIIKNINVTYVEWAKTISKQK